MIDFEKKNLYFLYFFVRVMVEHPKNVPKNISNDVTLHVPYFNWCHLYKYRGPFHFINEQVANKKLSYHYGGIFWDKIFGGLKFFFLKFGQN